MELSVKDRLILSNQYRILEKLYPDEAADLANDRKAIEDGYTLNYGWLTGRLLPELSEERCQEVWNILEMHRALFIYKDLKNKEGIEAPRFQGFDGNEETALFSYCTYIIEDLGRYKELKGDLNSHMPMLAVYAKMLDEWEKSPNKMKLTREDIIRVTSVGNPPE